MVLQSRSKDCKLFKPKWRGQIITVHVGTISATFGILLYNGDQILSVIEEYLTKMGSNCKVTRDRVINSKTLYQNIHIVCHWINQNVLGSQIYYHSIHPTTFS